MYCLVNIPEYILKDEYIKYRPLNEVGENTGNCLFWESTKNILRKENNNLLSIEKYLAEPEHYKDRISKVVFVCANLISNYDIKSTGLNYWNDKVKKILDSHLQTLNSIKCKKYLISIGAQSNNLQFFKFKKNQKEVLESFFSCFDVVYLRGQYTYDLLKYNEINSPHITSVGCPSLLLKPIDTTKLKLKLDKIKELHISQIKVGIVAGSMVGRKDISSHFVALMCDKTIHTLVQSGQDWLKFIKKESFLPPIESLVKIQEGLINVLKFFFLKLGIAKNRNNFVYNDNCLESIDYFKNNVHCMITTRIHGAVLGTLAGVPTLCLVTDSRTYELCEQMGIPYINCITNPKYFKNKKELIRIFLNNCIYSDKIDRTVENMKEKYAVISRV